MHTIEHAGWSFEIDGPELRLLKDTHVQVTLPLAPVVNGKAMGIGRWRAVDSDHYCATVAKLGTAHIALREGHVAYWIETKRKQFDCVSYFDQTTFNGERWQSYMSDEWDRLWDKDRDQVVGVSTCNMHMISVFGADPGGMPDPRERPPTYIWNIPPRAFSLQTTAGFVGFSIPGALPLAVMRLTMADRKFSCAFDTVRPACNDGMLPVVYIVPGLAGAHDVLDEHRVISDRLGLTRKKSSKHPSFWTQPVYKASLEYLRQWREIDEGKPLYEITQEYRDKRMAVINPENLRKWTYHVKKSLRVKEMNVMFEQGIFRIYGDYTPVRTLGGTAGFRRLVDEFHENGVHVCFYIHPFMVNTRIPYFQKHPEALCKPIDPTTETYYNTEHLYDADPKLGLIDWTHPLGRAYLLDQVEYIVSSKPGCLDVDWLRSNHWRGPDPRHYRFHDPDWGIGDMMSLKAQALIYEKAKSIKKHCLVSKASLGDCYMQPYADANLLCEDHVYDTKHWYERSDIASRLQRDMIFLTDPYHLSITKQMEYYFAMLVFCVAEVPDVEHAFHPYTCYLPMRPRDFLRRRAGMRVQENAPLNITDIVHVRRPQSVEDAPEIWRKRTEGPLAGWYAALALSKQAVVTYSEKEARVTGSEPRHVRFPLPPGAVVRAVDMVPHKGKTRAHPSTLVDCDGETWIDLRIEDAGGSVLPDWTPMTPAPALGDVDSGDGCPAYYRVRYRLEP